ncbi:MAG: dTDP-4-dehydrorhamnose reductase [Gammaproteobacteria bacterium]
MNVNDVPIVLLIGKSGQVGWELQRTLMPLGKIVSLGRADLNLESPDSIRGAIRTVNPQIIVNAAAYTAVDKAETESDLAMKINGDAPGIMAEEAKKQKALLIHYSTDYVFDGTKKQAYIETDTPNPLNHYGFSKLAGEQAIRSIGQDYLIFRTTWVYAARGQNFLNTVLRLGHEREELKMIADQFGAPTWARSIAEITAHVIKQALLEKKAGDFFSELYHMTASGHTSWFGFAEKIIENMRRTHDKENVKVRVIQPIGTDEYPLPAKRPKNSILSNEAFLRRFPLFMPNWEESLLLCLEEKGVL